MSDDGYSDTYSDDFGPCEDNYYEDDDLAALIDAMAETAFAPGDPIWDEFDVEFDMTEYHSDWKEDYSDGGFYEEEEVVVPRISGGGNNNKKMKEGGGSGGGIGKDAGKEGDSGGRRMRIPPRKRRKIDEVVSVGVGVGVGTGGGGGEGMAEEEEVGDDSEAAMIAGPGTTSVGGGKSATVIVPVVMDDKRNGVPVEKDKEGKGKEATGQKVDTRKRRTSTEGTETL